MALLNGSGTGGDGGQVRKMEQLAQSATFTVMSRVLSGCGWTIVLALLAFFAPKLWDWGVDVKAQQAESQRQQTELAHALDRVTWRLQTNEEHDQRQDRRMDFHDKRFDRVEQGRSGRPPLPDSSLR